MIKKEYESISFFEAENCDPHKVARICEPQLVGKRPFATTNICHWLKSAPTKCKISPRRIKVLSISRCLSPRLRADFPASISNLFFHWWRNACMQRINHIFCPISPNWRFGFPGSAASAGRWRGASLPWQLHQRCIPKKQGERGGGIPDISQHAHAPQTCVIAMRRESTGAAVTRTRNRNDSAQDSSNAGVFLLEERCTRPSHATAGGER